MENFSLRKEGDDATHVVDGVVWACIVGEFVVNVTDVADQVSQRIRLFGKLDFEDIVEDREKLVDHAVSCISTESIKTLKYYTRANATTDRA